MGYFEQILNKERLDCEIAYLGILEDYFKKKLGGHILSEAIKKIFWIWSKKGMGSHMLLGSQTCIKELFIKRNENI